jgi:hypothetical protein
MKLTHLFQQDVGEEKKEGETAPAATEAAAAPAEVEANTEVHPLTDITNQTQNNTDSNSKKDQTRPQRERRERGPPADGIPSKTKVMVANLPYDLTEEKVSLTIKMPRYAFYFL